MAVDPEVYRRVLLKLGYKIKGEVQRLLQENRINDRGLLSSTISVRPEGDTVVVGSPMTYAPAIEYGSAPHMPPVDAIEGWVQRKLGIPAPESRSVAWAIAKNIARDGTVPMPVFRTAIGRADVFLKQILREI